MTSRRGFLGLLGAVTAAFALDPERALWVPGAKTISIPAPRSGLKALYLKLISRELRDNPGNPMGATFDEIWQLTPDPTDAPVVLLRPGSALLSYSGLSYYGRAPVPLGSTFAY